MKKDKLEQFITDHRTEFDSESPPPMVWMNLEKELGARKKQTLVHPIRMPSIMRIMQVAAMFVVVMGVGLLIGLQINGNKVPYSNPNLQEFVEAERHYNNQIDNMWKTVKSTSAEDAGNIEDDLKSLDDVYQELKTELLADSEGGNTDVIVNAMIDNYRTKIEVLETVLEKYQNNKSNQLNNLEDDKVEI